MFSPTSATLSVTAMVSERLFSRRQELAAPLQPAAKTVIAIERGAEVVVIRYDKGIAYVRRWDDLSNGLP